MTQTQYCTLGISPFFRMVVRALVDAAGECRADSSIAARLYLHVFGRHVLLLFFVLFFLTLLIVSNRCTACPFYIVLRLRNGILAKFGGLLEPPQKKWKLSRSAIHCTSALRALSAMSLLSNDEASAFAGKVHRDRSYSDAHYLVHGNRHAPHGNDDTAMSADNVVHSAIGKASVAPICIKVTPCGNKKHQSSQRQHHGSGRPRSKSLDVQRHSSTDPIHKKKYAHHHTHPSLGRDHQHHGRDSPAFTTMTGETTPRKLQGKMWIRPAAASSPLPILLPTRGGAAWAERSPVPRVHQAMIEDGIGVAITSSSPTTPNDDPSPMARQVTSSPFIFSRDSFDDEMLLLPSSAMFPDSSPSFGPYHHRMQGHGMTRTIFGESGKPIKPRAAYSERHAPRFSNLSS